MKLSAAFFAVLGTAMAQGVTQTIAPSGSYPAGSVKDVSGDMWVTVMDVTQAAKRSIVQRASGACVDGNLRIKLANGVLTDSMGRTGYIASNYQFQFDAPAQAGAIYTAGFSQFPNGSLALGSSTTFYKCKSGDFWNLYDRSWANQCEPVQMAAYSCASTGGGAVGQISDGQIIATQFVTTTMVRPISDGQPQVITTAVPVPMCQIGDGQVQVHTTPCASITYVPAAPPSSAAPVSQYSDGQIQVTSAGSAKPSTAPQTTRNSSSGGSGSSSSSTPATSSSSASSPAATTPIASSAGRTKMESIAALLVGLIGALAFL